MAKRLAQRDWGFVSDPTLQGILRRDYEELRRLARLRADKSIVVMCGSIMEAFLASLLSQDIPGAEQALKEKLPGKSIPPFEQWNLYTLIQAAVKLGYLDGSTEIQATVIKDYRNLIHPLLQYRKAVALNSGTVNAALSLLDGVLDSVEKTRVNDVLESIRSWAERNGFISAWTPAETYLPELHVDGEKYTPLAVRKDHKIQIRFGNFKGKLSDLRYPKVREEMRQKLNRIHGFNIPRSAIHKLPAVPIEPLIDPQARNNFLQTLDWMVSIIRKQ